MWVGRTLVPRASYLLILVNDILRQVELGTRVDLTEQFSQLIFVRKMFFYRPCEACKNSITISIGLKEMVPIKTAYVLYHENGP